jgi:hypothetical protein
MLAAIASPMLRFAANGLSSMQTLLARIKKPAEAGFLIRITP